MTDQQTTFADQTIMFAAKALTENQRRILSLVNCQLTQAQIAKKLGFSRPYINQQIKRLQALNLVKRIDTNRTRQGMREYNYFYELAPELIAKIQKGAVQVPFTACRVHNIRKKWKIINQGALPSKDRRTSYSKSWFPRGGERYKYWYPGKAGLPSVTIDVHPKTIVAYVDKGQTIPGRTIREAEETAYYALYLARDKWIEQQQHFGKEFVVETTGENISEPHYGFPLHVDTGIGKENITMKDWWKDKSPEEQLGPGIGEVETKKFEGGTQLDEGLQAIQNLPETIRAAMPESLQQIGPLTTELHAVMAHIQSGMSVDNRVNQLTMMFAEMLKNQHEILELLAKNQTKEYK